MKVRYTAGALDDLLSIARYLSEHDRQAASRVGLAIRNTIETLESYPERGRRQDMFGVRNLVVQKLGYLIYYALDERADAIDILSILHPARARPFQDV